MMLRPLVRRSVGGAAAVTVAVESSTLCQPAPGVAATASPARTPLQHVSGTATWYNLAESSVPMPQFLDHPDHVSLLRQDHDHTIEPGYAR